MFFLAERTDELAATLSFSAPRIGNGHNYPSREVPALISNYLSLMLDDSDHDIDDITSCVFLHASFLCSGRQAMLDGNEWKEEAMTSGYDVQLTAHWMSRTSV